MWSVFCFHPITDSNTKCKDGDWDSAESRSRESETTEEENPTDCSFIMNQWLCLSPLLPIPPLFLSLSPFLQPCLIRTEDFYQTEDSYYIVLELWVQSCCCCKNFLKVQSGVLLVHRRSNIENLCVLLWCLLTSCLHRKWEYMACGGLHCITSHDQIINMGTDVSILGEPIRTETFDLLTWDKTGSVTSKKH